MYLFVFGPLSLRCCSGVSLAAGVAEWGLPSSRGSWTFTVAASLATEHKLESALASAAVVPGL